jgi:hypothetical protein
MPSRRSSAGKDTERFIEEVRGDEPERASQLTVMGVTLV